MKIAGLETHPAADLFPLMEGAELKALAEDIKKNGLRNPVVLYAENGKRLVLDGRNRLRACEMAGVMADTEFWVGEGSPVEWVVSQNLHRRHLTTSQRAIVAAGLVPMFEAEAHARQTEGLKRGDKRPVSANLREREPVHAAQKAAEAVNVAPRTVESALRVQREATPDVVEAIKAGEMTVHAAEESLKGPRVKKDHSKQRSENWTVPRSPRRLAAFLRQRWTTAEWREFMRAAEEAAA